MLRMPLRQVAASVGEAAGAAGGRASTPPSSRPRLLACPDGLGHLAGSRGRGAGPCWKRPPAGMRPAFPQLRPERGRKRGRAPCSLPCVTVTITVTVTAAVSAPRCDPRMRPPRSPLAAAFSVPWLPRMRPRVLPSLPLKHNVSPISVSERSCLWGFADAEWTIACLGN